MKDIFISSDLHLFHRNIVNFVPTRSEKWGSNYEKMSQDIIDAHFDTLIMGCTWYFLGDLYFQVGSRKDQVADMLQALRVKCGEMHWIVGNHDEPERCPQVAELFDSVSHAQSIHAFGKTVFMSHYPLDIGGFDVRRLISLHGHVHGTSRNYPGRLDVGVDSLIGLVEGYDYGAVRLEEIVDLIQGDYPAVQNHRRPKDAPGH